jgi:3-hydroxyacyl-[acyl-carrier-protein] dehydratase
MLTRADIEAIIPHRSPFLLVDRAEGVIAGERATGYLDVRGDAFWVPGHFPDFPVMPGVLIVEALAQVGAIALLSLDENRGRIALFAGIEKVRFRRQVTPGDTLRMEVAITKTRGPLGFGEASAYVDDGLVCTGELMFAIKL